ncbi:MAG: CDP-alcohol phosphatidyltransferase family protein [Thioclava marina]|uniref:CDP-alcohol phosphatidyltransferase family protein n=1 Tax=Thioclava marina TaxID=1915077 RepID=UPI0019CA3E75|nr:CDP-alcohol phosphatidyltransferase family protein [Thioclava marina]MBC7147148.1 CDP-alcohol phosphatidyltransferase family protein [Thioclava marina]
MIQSPLAPQQFQRLLAAARADRPSGAALRLASAGLPLGLVAASIIAPWGFTLAVLSFIAVAFGTIAISLAFRRSYPHGRLGLCNVVTLSRATLIVTLLAPLLAHDPATEILAWSITAIATLAFAMDGLDGWLARRSALVSRIGARFDMETDAALGFVLSLLVFASGTVGAWVLLLGSMRYIYIALAQALPWLNAPLPESFRRKTICVVQIAALIVLTIPGVDGLPAQIIAAAATLALAWSFATDIVWLSRARA